MLYGFRNHDINQKCSERFPAGSIVASVKRIHTLESGCELWKISYDCRHIRKIAKKTISFVMSACPSVRMRKHGSHWAHFHGILYLNIYPNSVANIQFSSQYDMNDR
jgi:hypothetical protein